ncbi:MAG: NAD-dependent epimerase/dehydratase family protein [Chloroflexi bacterium]|nr:NAD-dependent epimerase/dehydratase family protein [Chloroflexota bacterium]MCL5273253.1 NAD-dependent epimerase/dehydratase family protein [Chloroflexota bacterium]
MAERYLVTGALGCIGAWTVKRLVDEGAPVWAYDLPGEPHRLRLIMNDAALAKVNFIQGDITDADAFDRAVADNGITHIIHLAALQVPFVRANPILGAKVNVVGSTVVLETARRHVAQIQGLAYASSVGVYGGAELYPDGLLRHDSPLHPLSLYGVFKQASEGTARIYWQDWGVRSIGIRPYVIYGPGRDQGMSSTPTKAMLAAAVGRSYHISYGGTIVFQYADDAARAFIQAVRAHVEGAPVYNLGGLESSIDSVVQAINSTAPETSGRITFNPEALPTPPHVDGAPLEAAIGALHWTRLEDGVRQTIDIYRAAASAGKIDVDRILA